MDKQKFLEIMRQRGFRNVAHLAESLPRRVSRQMISALLNEKRTSEPLKRELADFLEVSFQYLWDE